MNTNIAALDDLREKIIADPDVVLEDWTGWKTPIAA